MLVLDEVKEYSRISPKKGNVELLAHTFRQEICNGRFRPGDQLPTVRELAHKTKLGYNIVNRAISVLEKDGLVQKKRGAGTFISNDVKLSNKKDTIKIAVILPPWAENASQYVVSGLLHGVNFQTLSCGYRLELVPNQKDESFKYDFVDKVLSYGVDGVIWLQPMPMHEANLAVLAHEKIPLAVTGRRFPNLPIECVTENVDRTAQLVINLMKEQGRKSLVMLSGPILDAYSADRINAIKKESAAKEIQFDDDSVIVSFDHYGGLFGHEDGVKRFLEKHSDFDTVFSLHPVLKEVVNIHQSGIKHCPKDFIVVEMGADVLPIRQQWPQIPIYTIDWPLSEMGKKAVNIIQKQISQEEDIEDFNLMPILSYSNGE